MEYVIGQDHWVISKTVAIITQVSACLIILIMASFKRSTRLGMDV